MKHWGESYKNEDQWSFEKHGDLWNTKEKVRKKNISDLLKNMEIYETQRRKLEKRR